jgi:hypothetical protein
METSEKRSPQHLKLINTGLNWDWRRESPVEIILLVFVLLFFFFLPREGCGVTTLGTGEAPAQVEVAPH